MKLAHTELIKDCWGVEPIFIADDIASELDTERREFLLKHLLEKNVQVFLSAADPRFVPEDHDCDVFRVTVSSEDQNQVENHVRAAIIS
jgi:recombinational DNA repair ATPase RecF